MPGNPWAPEAIDLAADSSTNLDGAIIRIHPTRIMSFGIDEPDQGPHLLIPNSRDVTGPPRT